MTNPKKKWEPRLPEMHDVFWRCTQVSGALAPSEIKDGTKLRFCEHAMREYSRGIMPSKSRFFSGRVTRLVDGLMTIAFDEGQVDAPVSMTCGVEEYARYCIPAARKERVPRVARARDSVKAAKMGRTT